MISSTFFGRWVWPAGGSGGIPGDVVATMIVFGVVMLILYFISAFVVWLVEKGARPA